MLVEAAYRFLWQALKRVHLNFVKTQKLNAFRQEVKVDKEPNLRYFYKYGMLPLTLIFFRVNHRLN